MSLHPKNQAFCPFTNVSFKNIKPRCSPSLCLKDFGYKMLKQQRPAHERCGQRTRWLAYFWTHDDPSAVMH